MEDGGHSRSPSCSICFEEYKTPKVLPCGHTFCYQCISKMVDRHSSLQCPTCRRDIPLPESGKVDDFPTNFALMNFVPGQYLKEKVDSVCECPIHKTSMEFYCESCEKQVCAKCLLNDHKPDKHNIVTASDTVKNLSKKLQKLKTKLKSYKEEEESLGEKISEASDGYQIAKERIEQDIKIALEMQQERLKKSSEDLLDELNKRVEGQAGKYEDLKTQHNILQTFSNLIYDSCEDLNQQFQQLDLSQSNNGIEKISDRIETLKDAIESLKIACQSIPTNVGLKFKPSRKWQLGKLTKVPNKPILTEEKNGDTMKDESCNDHPDQEKGLNPNNADGSDSNSDAEDWDLGCDEPVFSPTIPDTESLHRHGNARLYNQNANYTYQQKSKLSPQHERSFDTGVPQGWRTGQQMSQIYPNFYQTRPNHQGKLQASRLVLPNYSQTAGFPFWMHHGPGYKSKHGVGSIQPASATDGRRMTLQQNAHIAGHAPLTRQLPTPLTRKLPALTAEILAQAQPHEQKQMLGERLFAIIQKSHGQRAGKITGMLLENDNAQLLNLLESPEVLDAMVKEAVSVLASIASNTSQWNNLKDNQKPAQQNANTIGHTPLTAEMLAQVSVHEQQQMLGERLFSIIQQKHREQAGKITGMLLELDNGEVLHLLDSPEALNAKVKEALDVLAKHQKEQPACKATSSQK